MIDGVDPNDWRDFLANRQRKRLANTPAAHRRLVRDISRFSDDDWPPGKLIAHAAEQGWAAIFDPRNSMNGQTNGSTNWNSASPRRSAPIDGFTAAIRQVADAGAHGRQ